MDGDDYTNIPAKPPPSVSAQSLLTFNGAGREASFVSTATPSWIKLDTVIFTMATVVGPVKILSWTTPGVYKALLHHTWLILSSVVCSLLFLRGIKTHPGWYQRKRVALLSLFRIFLALGTSMIMYIEDPLHLWAPSGGVLTLFMKMASKTSVTPLWSSALGLPIPFKKHVWIHGASTLISASWVSNLCRACDSDAGIVRSTNELGWWTEWIIQRIAVFGFPVKTQVPKDGAFPCSLVGLFFHIWLGFVLPSMLLYGMEIIWRARFLMNSLGASSSEGRMFKISGLVVGGLYFLVGSQLLWFGLKEVIASVPLCESPLSG